MAPSAADSSSQLEPEIGVFERVFEDPGTFFSREYPEGHDGYMIIHAQEPGKYGTEIVRSNVPDNVGKIHVFDTSKPYSMMVTGLRGCSSVVVASRLGIYMNHLWEQPSFLGNIIGEPPDETLTLPTFNTDVLQLIPNGGLYMPALLPEVAANRPFGTEGAQEWAELEDGNLVQAAIVSPQKEKDTPVGNWRYPAHLRWLDTALRGWLPGVAPVQAGYPQDWVSKRENMDNMARTARGKVLFEYDPKAGVYQDTDENGVECDRWFSAYRVFNAENPVPILEDQ